MRTIESIEFEICQMSAEFDALWHSNCHRVGRFRRRPARVEQRIGELADRLAGMRKIRDWMRVNTHVIFVQVNGESPYVETK